MEELLKQIPSLAPYIKTVLPYIHQYGYWAIFFAIFLEDFGLPMPGETILIICSLFAALGELNLFLVGIIGFLGAVLGDNTGFFIGKQGGRKLILKFGKYIFLTPKRMNKLETFFENHGGKIVAVARFIQGLRQFNGIIAGISKMKWKKFIFYNIIGALLWVGLWTGTATILSSNVNLLISFLKKSEFVFPILFLIPFIISGIMKLINSRKKTDNGENP